MLGYWMGWWCDGHLEYPVVRGMEREVVPVKFSLFFFVWFLVLVLVRNGEGGHTFAAQLLKSLPSPSPYKIHSLTKYFKQLYILYSPSFTNLPNLLHLRSSSSLLSFFLSPHFILTQKFEGDFQQELLWSTWSVALSAQQPSTRKVQKPWWLELIRVVSEICSKNLWNWQNEGWDAYSNYTVIVSPKIIFKSN